MALTVRQLFSGGGSFKLSINVAGFNATRRNAEIQARLHEIGERIADAAGGAPDFLVFDEPSKTRARVTVVTATRDAMVAEATYRDLTRAFAAGRGA